MHLVGRVAVGLLSILALLTAAIHAHGADRPTDAPRDGYVVWRRPSTLHASDDWRPQSVHRRQADRSGRVRQVESRFTLPGEFEKQGALLLGCHELARDFPEVLADIVSAVQAKMPVIALVRDTRDRDRVLWALERRQLTPEGVVFAAVPHDTMWARDYGPIFVRKPSGGRAVIDADYGLRGRQQDDRVSQRIASHFGVPIFHLPLRTEGGNLLSNGGGVCLTTYQLVDENFQRNHDEASIAALFNDYFGFHETVFLEPLVNEPTGHVDMFATFTAPDTVVVGSYDPQLDPINAEVLNRNAARLSRVRTRHGSLRVVRVPMPPNDDGVWRTYTNAIYANGVMLMPIFPGVDRPYVVQALRTFGQLLPGWQIVPIDISDVMPLGGGLHCLVMNLAVPHPLPGFPQPDGPRGDAAAGEGRGVASGLPDIVAQPGTMPAWVSALFEELEKSAD